MLNFITYDNISTILNALVDIQLLLQVDNFIIHSIILILPGWKILEKPFLLELLHRTKINKLEVNIIKTVFKLFTLSIMTYFC